MENELIVINKEKIESIYVGSYKLDGINSSKDVWAVYIRLDSGNSVSKRYQNSIIAEGNLESEEEAYKMLAITHYYIENTKYKFVPIYTGANQKMLLVKGTNVASKLKGLGLINEITLDLTSLIL